MLAGDVGAQQWAPALHWRSSRGKPINAPAAFIHPCQPIVGKQPPSGPGWAHELKHDGYRLHFKKQNVVSDRDRAPPPHAVDWAKVVPPWSFSLEPS